MLFGCTVAYTPDSYTARAGACFRISVSEAPQVRPTTTDGDRSPMGIRHSHSHLLVLTLTNRYPTRTLELFLVEAYVPLGFFLLPP